MGPRKSAKGGATGAPLAAVPQVGSGSTPGAAHRDGNASSGIVPNGRAEELDASGCIGFLESIGLWEEAKAIKTSGPQPGKAPPRRGRRMDAFQAAQAYARQALAPQRHLSKHYFVRALCALRAYSGPAEAVEALNLSSLTADE